MASNSDDSFKPPIKKLENPFLNGSNGIKPPYGFSPSGMLRPKELQPPPMYGPRGTTIPPKFLPNYVKNFKPHHNNNKPNNWNQNRNNDYQNHNPKKLYCESCDREFQNRHKLDEHKKEHVRCTIPGCMFKGHSKSLERHIEEQHTSGLFDKIKNLNTPEEIAKWCEERKKRYPSKRNIELRQLAQEERFKRGEKLDKTKSRFGKKGDRERNIKGNKNEHQGPKYRRNNQRRRDDIKQKVIKEVQPSAAVVESDEVDESINCNIKRFTGTSQLVDYVVGPKKIVSKDNPLSALLGMYGSSDEEEHDKSEPEEGEISDVEVVPPEFNEESEIELSSGEEPEEIKNEKVVEQLPPILEPKTPKPPDNANPKKRKRHNLSDQKAVPVKKPKSLLDNPRYKCSKQNTLLAKLLEPDIRHERNMLLQCVRYVVENKFFGIGSENKT